MRQGSQLPIGDGHPTLHKESLGIYGYINTLGVVDHPSTINQFVFASPTFVGLNVLTFFLRALASATHATAYGNHQDIGWIIQATATSENLSFDEPSCSPLFLDPAFLNCSLVIIVDHNISQLWHHSSKKPRQVTNVSEVVGICMQVSKPQGFLRLFCVSLDTPSLE